MFLLLLFFARFRHTHTHMHETWKCSVCQLKAITKNKFGMRRQNSTRSKSNFFPFVLYLQHFFNAFMPTESKRRITSKRSLLESKNCTFNFPLCLCVCFFCVLFSRSLCCWFCSYEVIGIVALLCKRNMKNIKDGTKINIDALHCALAFGFLHQFLRFFFCVCVFVLVSVFFFPVRSVQRDEHFYIFWQLVRRKYLFCLIKTFNLIGWKFTTT